MSWGEIGQSDNKLVGQFFALLNRCGAACAHEFMIAAVAALRADAERFENRMRRTPDVLGKTYSARRARRPGRRHLWRWRPNDE